MTTVHHIAPLAVAIPLLCAAAIVMTGFAPRTVHALIGVAGAAATTVVCAILLAHVRHGTVVEWLGGWRPHHGVALGIALAVDQLGAGMATLAAGLTCAALVFAFVYFDSITGLFHALMLVFLAAMVGFCLSGDLFNMVVFFVLMGVAAYGLTSFEIGQPVTIQGGITFAVTNSVAGFAALFGIALIYGRTGALNLAQIGAALGHHADALVAVGFGLIAIALLTKAAAAPFHFWLPDAHAVAPAPVSAVFSGVMAELGVFGIARLLATAFAGPLGTHAGAIRAVLAAVGALTALLGAIACFEQRHLKRMLGFATVAHVGVMLCGVALLDAHALAGAALYALGFGLAIAALFLATGILALRYGTVDDYDLHGRGRSSPFAGLLYALGGASLACAPLLTSGFGGALIGDAARRLGYGWLVAVFVIAWALTSGAVLRTAACVFLGWGPGERRAAGRPDASEEEAQETAAAEEGSGALDREAGLPALLAIPAVLSAAATGAGLVPGFVPSVVRAAARFEDHAAYASTVLTGRRPTYHAVEVGHVSTAAVVLACAALAGALVIAALALFGRRLADRLPRPLLDAPLRVVDVVRAAHSGHVGDYVAWWTFGAAAIGGLLLWTVAG